MASYQRQRNRTVFITVPLSISLTACRVLKFPPKTETVMSKKKVLLASVVIVCVMILLQVEPFRTYITGPIKLDNIPHLSCTEMSRGGKLLKRSHTGTHGDILVGIRLTERTGYSEFTASVIHNYHDISDVDITVFTTRGLHYDTVTLRHWYGRNTRIIELPSDETAVGKIMEEFVRTEYKVLFLIDSEMVFLPAWRDFISQRMLNPKHKAISFLSLYHSATMHSYTSDCEDFEGDLCKGKIIGKYGVAITKDFALAALKNHPETLRVHDWDKLLEKEGYGGLYPTESLIMSIGQTEQDANFCGINDVPYGFKLCELPCWIRNGIEFYFDLCTNPNEIFLPDFSLENATSEDRLWTRPALVYSFYGNKARYVKGAIENAKRLYTIYPGYKIWAYVDHTVATDVIQTLCSCNVKFINMTGSQIRNQMSWRFLIAAEPVRWFTILDIDFRLLKRGKDATDDWLQSGRIFHVMRDHPNHSKYPINGQMWGGYGNSIRNVKELIVQYNARDTYMNDIYFLSDRIWPIIKNSVWVHDAYSMHKFGEDHPFPTERKGGEFVGNVDFSGD